MFPYIWDATFPGFFGEIFGFREMAFGNADPYPESNGWESLIKLFKLISNLFLSNGEQFNIRLRSLKFPRIGGKLNERLFDFAEFWNLKNSSSV